MLKEGSKVKTDNGKYIFEVMSIDRQPENPDYDIFWLMWADKSHPEIYGISLYTGYFRKELTEAEA